MITTTKDGAIIISYEEGDEIPIDALVWKILEIGDNFVKVLDPFGQEKTFPKPIDINE